jgi:ribosomal protein L11 methyltransferase
MTYIEIIFNTNSTEQNEILIALLNEIGFEGFEEEDNILKAFIKQNEFSAAAVDEIANSNQLTYTTTSIAQQNWNAQWESSFEPVVINDFAAIRASFHKPVKNVQYEIIITPKMSFGTGHHATTYLMMEQMSQLNFTGKTVMDFGTGTGVLAILAQKMGATEVLAIDNDYWSIDNAKENIGNNKSIHIVIQKGEAIGADKKYDIILANINLNVIVQNMPLIAAACKPGAQILLSGFLYTDVVAIKSSLHANGLIFSVVTQQKDWVCIVALHC